MKTKYFFLAAAAALFAACSSDDGIAEQQQQAKQQAEQVPVAFDYYVGRGTTRAGMTGDVTPATIKTANVGFGVFAYYTNADSYDPSSFMPNFMYNQQVKASGTGDDATWGYAPLKYWPNEFGTGARSEDVDKISFFAYAPYVSVNPASGKVMKKWENSSDPKYTYDADDGEATMGIVGMTRNNVTGDPMVKYISTFYTDEQVDLVWGTVPASAATWAKKNSGSQSFTEGTPWKDVEHPSATSSSWSAAQKVKFQFLHSLAALNVTVDTKTNKTTPNDLVDDASKVYIRSVTFEGFDTKGALNLNNTTALKPLWYNFNCDDELNRASGIETIIKDGRKDGKEGINAATSEYAVINPDFVQSTIWGSTTPAEAPGVTGTAKNLFRLKTAASSSFVPADDAPIYVIPNGDPLKVTIEYDVLTQDDNLVGKLNDGATHGSVVKNVITRYITTGGAGDPQATPTNPFILENGKRYTISLHLGLNSVEFDAGVTAWTTGTGGADLPHNNN